MPDNSANMTMGIDCSPLFGDICNCMAIQVLEIKKMVCLGVLLLVTDNETDTVVLDRYIYTSVSCLELPGGVIHAYNP